MKISVSVFIITQDEEDRIKNSIRSVRDWVDEVIVVDSGSQDATCQIARDAGADQVLFHEWAGYGQQKRFAEDQCRNPWLLNLDADEEISPKLKDEITTLFLSTPPASSAYTLRILNILPFEKKPSLFATRNTCLRLYNKTIARFRDDAVHDSIIFNPDAATPCTKKLKGIVYHRSFRNLQHMTDKNIAYSEMQARQMVLDGRVPSQFRIFIEPLFSFIKMYILRRHIFYGGYGLAMTTSYVHCRVYRLARARELFALSRENN